MQSCWNLSPELRPGFSSLTDSLGVIFSTANSEIFTSKSIPCQKPLGGKTWKSSGSNHDGITRPEESSASIVEDKHDYMELNYSYYDTNQEFSKTCQERLLCLPSDVYILSDLTPIGKEIVGPDQRAESDFSKDHFNVDFENS